MNRKLAVIMDPIESINPKKDTTLGLMAAAQKRGWALYYCQPQDIGFQQQTIGRLQALTVSLNEQNWFDFQGEPIECPLQQMDAVLMRKDPPFDSEYIYSTYLLESAESQGVLVVNRPQSLRDCNEKFFATQFSQHTPPLLVSKNLDQLKRFHAEYQDVIYKPLDGMGGTSIFRVTPQDPNLNVILETLTAYGSRTIMAQQYLPEIVQGDKRILMVNGVAVPYCLARIPRSGETRGNLAAGGRGVVQPLSEMDQAIANSVGPELVKRGIYFAGLDVIGKHLTEVNVTSPTCLREISNETGIDIADQLISVIENKIRHQRTE